MEQDLSSSMLASAGLDRTDRAVWTIHRSAKRRAAGKGVSVFFFFLAVTAIGHYHERKGLRLTVSEKELGNLKSQITHDTRCSDDGVGSQLQSRNDHLFPVVFLQAFQDKLLRSRRQIIVCFLPFQSASFYRELAWLA